MEIVLQIFINGVLAAAIYGLVAGGLSFLYATTKIFHLAHGVVVIGGGYAFWWAWTALHLPAWVAALLAVAVAAVAGLAMNEFVYETLRRRGTKGLGYLIATLALLTCGTALVLMIFGAAPKSFDVQTASLSFGGDARITVLQIWIVAISALLLTAFWWIVRYSRFGKAMRATADNETVAEVLGINTRNIRRFAFLLSSVLAASAGILVGLEFGLDPNMGVILVIRGFAAAVIGGVGSFGGALAGSLIVGLLEQVTGWFWGAGWRNASVFLLLFIFLLFKPSGFFGGKRET